MLGAAGAITACSSFGLSRVRVFARTLPWPTPTTSSPSVRMHPTLHCSASASFGLGCLYHVPHITNRSTVPPLYCHHLPHVYCRYPALEWQYPPHQRQGSYEEEGRSVNHMKAGIITADRVVTVSRGDGN